MTRLLTAAACLLLLGLALVQPARAADDAALAAAVSKLGDDGFAARTEAVEVLGQLGDGRAIAPLRALSDGFLYKTAQGAVAIGKPSGDKIALTDAVTGASLGSASESELDKLRVNNRVRGALSSSLGLLVLFSPDKAERLAAAREATRFSAPETAAVLARALAAEKDPEVRGAMEFSLQAARLNAGTQEERLAAIKALGGSTDPQIRRLLGQVVGDAAAPEPVRAAAREATDRIESRLKWIGFAGNLFQGVSLGSVLLLAATGLAITFGVMGVINMAHGEMMMIGAYATYVVQELFRAFLPPGWIDAYLIVAMPVAFLVAGAVGIAIERTVIRFLYGRPLETMLATWGISLILQQAVRSIFGAPNKEVANPSWMTGGFEVVGFVVTWNRLAIIAFCFLVLGGLAAIMRRTSLGLHMRAVTQNRPMAAVMGIPTNRVDALTFGLGSGIAGIAGVALSQIGNVSPNLGQIYIVDSFMVVVFGGVGNLLGTLTGALSLGILNKLLEPYAGAVLGKIVVLVAIILFIQKRPRGLFALKGRAAEM